MNPMQPLQALLAQAERERDDAWGQAKRASDRHASATSQADELLAYRREYEQRWNEQFRSGGHMDLVHCYRSFMERLTHALEQQQRIVQQAAQHMEQARAQLQEHELRVASVRKLIERRHREMLLTAQRQEQKQTDEFSARMSWKAASATPPANGLPRSA
jgi:flagellar FliJ protein